MPQGVRVRVPLPPPSSNISTLNSVVAARVQEHVGGRPHAREAEQFLFAYCVCTRLNYDTCSTTRLPSKSLAQRHVGRAADAERADRSCNSPKRTEGACMQDWRFDDLTRTLGGATSRRQVFKGLLVGVLAATVGRSIRATPASAASECSQATCRRRAEAAFSECVAQSRRSHGGVQSCVDELLARTRLCAETGCLENESCCGGACTELDQDAQNCGSCGNVCPTGVNCVAGVCDCGPG